MDFDFVQALALHVLLFLWSNSPVAFEELNSQSSQLYCFPSCLISMCLFSFSLVATSSSHWLHFNLCEFCWCPIKSWRLSVLNPQMGQRWFEKLNAFPIHQVFWPEKYTGHTWNLIHREWCSCEFSEHLWKRSWIHKNHNSNQVLFHALL